MFSFAAVVLLQVTAVLVVIGGSRTKSQLVLWRSNKRADHAAIVVRYLVVDDIEPEQVSTRLRIATQVTEILH
jgi:hypothetical protein